MSIQKHKVSVELGAIQRETVERAASTVLAALGNDVEGYKVVISIELVDERTIVETLLDEIRAKLSKSRGVGVEVKHTAVDKYMTTGDAWSASPMARALEDMGGTLGAEAVTISHGDNSVTLGPRAGKGIDLQ